MLIRGESEPRVLRPRKIAALGDDKTPPQLYKNWFQKYFVNFVELLGRL